MVKELQRLHYLKWDGRLSNYDRKWYDSLMERQIVQYLYFMKHIDGSVNIVSVSFREIPEILNGVHVKGNFDVSFNILRNLNNSPVKVDGKFKCLYNRNLKTLAGAQKEVSSI